MQNTASSFNPLRSRQDLLSVPVWIAGPINPYDSVNSRRGIGMMLQRKGNLVGREPQ